MSVRVLPNVEAIAAEYLRGHEDLRELIGGSDPDAPDVDLPARVHGKIPKNPVFPLVTLRGTGGTEPVLDHLVAGRVLFHIWGRAVDESSRAETDLIGRTVRAVMGTLIGIHQNAVVTSVRPVVGQFWQPDPETNRDRHILELAVFAHPLPINGS